MNPISIYTNLLLPDIAEFCQNFFPSLIEQSYEENKEPPNALRNIQIKECTNLFMSQLQASLTFNNVNSHAGIIFALQSEDDIREANRFGQYLKCATQKENGNVYNPLEPNNIINNIVFCMQKTNHQKIGSIVEHFKNQFDAVAFGFYKKLNSLCENYFDIDALTETPLIHNIKFPITDLDAPIHQQQPKAQLDSADQQEKKQGVASLSDAECIIKHIKWLYKHNINTQELHPSIHETTKKLYLPLINYAISNPTHYIQADNQFKLTTFIATLSRFHRHYDDNTLYQVQQLINHFIEAVLNQEASIESTHIKLLALTDKHILTAELINNNLPAAISQSKVDANPEPVLPTLDTELKNQLKPCIQEQAASIIAAIDASPSPSVANQLKHDWLKVLVVIGKIHGCQSTEWLHCVDIFSQLTQYSNFKQAPLALLYKVEAQLQFAGISTHELDLTVTPSPLNIDLDNRAKEGGWFEYTNGEQIIRCKLAAIIKQIGLYIFVTRHGKKILEINQDVLQAHLDSGDLVPLHTVSLNKTLEDIIKNIKQAQTTEYCEN